MLTAFGLIAGMAAAQDPVFSPRPTEACLQGARGAEATACIGRAAGRCIDSTPSGGTTLGMTGCLAQERDWWDARLNAAYQRLRAREDAEDRASVGMPGYVSQADALRDMQRAWIAFRDATCAYERSQWGGGSGGGPATVSCQMRLTGTQTLYLEAAERDW